MKIVSNALFNILATSLIIFIYLPVQSQVYQGYEKSNFSGVIGMDFQPASVVDNRTKLDILVGGFGSNIENNLIQLDILNIANFQHSEISSYLSGVEDLNIDTEGYVHVENQANILSAMFSPSKEFGIGLSIKGRNIASIDGFSSQTAEYLFDRLADISGPGYYPNNSFHYQSSSFLETGLTIGAGFGRKSHSFRIGITGNYLSGLDFLDLDVRELDLRVTDRDVIEANFDISYIRSQTFGEGAIPEQLGRLELSKNQGYSLNMGLVYEFRPKYKKHFYGPLGKPKLRDDLNKYHVRIGVSIRDLGWVNFKTDNQSTIFMDSISIDPSVLTLDNPSELETTLADVTQTGFSSEYTYNLPTQFNAYIDLRVTQSLYLNIAYRSLLDVTNTSQPQLIGEPQYILTPRIESRIAEFGIPVRVMGNRDILFGAYLRFGPFLIGSGTVGSFLTANKSYNLNGYAAFRVPLHRKKP